MKEIVKLFIPPVVYKLKSVFFSSRRNFFETISTIECSNKKLYIFGNGPSFSGSVNKIDYSNADIIAVNGFVSTDLFEKYKPNYYLIADPSLLNFKDAKSEFVQNMGEQVIKNFTEKLSWHISFIVSSSAHNSYLVKQLERNEYIEFYYYNTENFSCRKMSKYEQWDKNLLPPPAQTVLNTCLYLGLFLNYKQIEILGLDMTWHEDLELDQKTNKLFVVDKHFYGVKKREALLDLDGKGLRPAKVHEYLRCSVNALNSFWELREYADYKGCTVKNLSDHSWVDAFERG